MVLYQWLETGVGFTHQCFCNLYGVYRHVLMMASIAGFNAFNSLYNVHTINYLAKHVWQGS